MRFHIIKLVTCEYIERGLFMLLIWIFPSSFVYNKIFNLCIIGLLHTILFLNKPPLSFVEANKYGDIPVWFCIPHSSPTSVLQSLEALKAASVLCFSCTEAYVWTRPKTRFYTLCDICSFHGCMKFRGDKLVGHGSAGSSHWSEVI